jgi:sterol desaturase/sphingolipid hydroxylase (fatty acid hydroxylase superfamily)
VGVLGAIGWSFAGLCVIAILGVAVHETIRRWRHDAAPPVWRSPTFRSDVVYGVVGNLCFALAFAISLPWTRADGSALSIVAWTLALLLLHDAYFYWCHRLLHVPLLLRHVHAVHHRSTVPTPLSAMAMHPIEAMAEALFVPLVAIALHPPTTALYAFFVAMIGLNTLGHLGLRGVPLLNGRPGALQVVSQSDTHLQHHLTPDRDFGAYLTVWDRWFATSSRRS